MQSASATASRLGRVYGKGGYKFGAVALKLSGGLGGPVKRKRDDLSQITECKKCKLSKGRHTGAGAPMHGLAAFAPPPRRPVSRE